MKKIKNILTIGIMAFALVFASCDGDAGPAGPVGAAGQDGAAGADGAQGIPGDDGNANVQSITFDIRSLTNTNPIVLAVPQITQQVLDEDLVLVYLRQNFFSDPAIWILANGLGIIPDHVLNTEYTVGQVRIVNHFVDGSRGPPIVDYDVAKVIIIKASVILVGKDNLDYSDYYKVMEHYQLNY